MLMIIINKLLDKKDGNNDQQYMQFYTRKYHRSQGVILAINSN